MRLSLRATLPHAGGGAVRSVLQASGFVFLSLRMTRFLPGFLRSDASSIDACSGERVRHRLPAPVGSTEGSKLGWAAGAVVKVGAGVVAVAATTMLTL